MATSNHLYEDMIRIRAFEENLLDLFSKNMLSGTTHTYIGEEATAVALMQFVNEGDYIFSNHRCHGHYLAYGGPEEALLAEIMSSERGLCEGRGGSQHISYKNFYTNGIQGGIVPNALGVAWANKLNGNTNKVFVFVGDGTLGQGVVYEALNIAAVYELPVVFVVEDNQYAMSTKRQDVISGDISNRIRNFDVKTFEIASTDLSILSDYFKEVIDYIDGEKKPVCAIVHNYRLGAHSKSDDTRDPEEINENKKNDPLIRACEVLGEQEFHNIYNDCRKKYFDLAKELENTPVISIAESGQICKYANESYLSTSDRRCVEIIRDTFSEEIQNNKDVIFLGEDICDPYGGAFKVTKGLSSLKKEQIYNMPISEACMTGIGVGMALAGKIPVIEMMFGDFITLAFDQLLNHAAKYSWVYGNNVTVPMIIRAPMGAKRGYGPTHSQSLEKFLIGIPQINVFALSPVHDIRKIYENLFDKITCPTVVIENKKMYSEKMLKIENNHYDIFSVYERCNYKYSTIGFIADEDEADFTIVTYGGMVKESLNVASHLMLQDEIAVNVLVISQLAPIPILDVKDLNKNVKTICVVEEGTRTAGIGAEIVAQCAENGIGSNYIRIATADLPIPNGIRLEEQIVPNEGKIEEILKEKYYAK